MPCLELAYMPSHLGMLGFIWVERTEVDTDSGRKAQHKIKAQSHLESREQRHMEDSSSTKTPCSKKAGRYYDKMSLWRRQNRHQPFQLWNWQCVRSYSAAYPHVMNSSSSASRSVTHDDATQVQPALFLAAVLGIVLYPWEQPRIERLSVQQLHGHFAQDAYRFTADPINQNQVQSPALRTLMAWSQRGHN